MRMILILILCLPVWFSFAQESYSVLQLEEGTIMIDGQGEDSPWSGANVLQDFVYPWRTENAPRTTFKGLWDKEYLYFLYEVEDEGISLHDDCDQNPELCPVNSDRIEIFFRGKNTKDPYYSLEMDAKGRIFDSHGIFGKKGGIDREWDWPEGQLTIAASINDDGYVVEGRISLRSLRDLGLLDKDRLYAGLYRGEYIPEEGGKPLVKWISWIIPDSESPNFHIPSSFGTLELLGYKNSK